MLFSELSSDGPPSLDCLLFELIQYQQCGMIPVIRVPRVYLDRSADLNVGHLWSHERRLQKITCVPSMSHSYVGDTLMTILPCQQKSEWSIFKVMVEDLILNQVKFWANCKSGSGWRQIQGLGDSAAAWQLDQYELLSGTMRQPQYQWLRASEQENIRNQNCKKDPKILVSTEQIFSFH